MQIIKSTFGLKKKWIFLALIASVFLLIKVTLFAGDLDIGKWYKLYEERLKSICEPYKPEKTIFNTSTEGYVNIEKDKDKVYVIWMDYFTNAKKIYKDNMNNIYKCMILNSQIKSMKLVTDDLIKNSPELNKEIKGKIDEKINKLKFSFDKLKCKQVNEKNDSIQKLTLLRQTTYELCRYHSYLEYLREYNSDLENIELDVKDSYNTNDIVELEKERKNEIDTEISHIYKIYPIAFAAYNQYENNVTIHILLELVKEDYIAFRAALHKSLNPINQVVYKISNAMKLD